MPELGLARKGRPHVMERWGRVVLGVGVVGFAYLFFDWLGHADDVPRTLSLGGFMVSSVAGAVLILWGRRRGAGEVIRWGGRLCPRCRYPLSHVERMGMCPECGEAFTHEDNVAAWRGRYPWLRL